MYCRLVSLTLPDPRNINGLFSAEATIFRFSLSGGREKCSINKAITRKAVTASSTIQMWCTTLLTTSQPSTMTLSDKATHHDDPNGLCQSHFEGRNPPERPAALSTIPKGMHNKSY